MPYRVLSHTADTGIEATAPGLEQLIEELAAGMFALMVEIDPCTPTKEVQTTIEFATVEDLAVDALAELLYRFETEDVLFCRFHAALRRPGRLELRAAGVDARSVELGGPPIKAVTYHDLVVTETGDGWFGRVYFDV